MDSLSDKDLIINHTVFFAYFCHLIETNQADDSEKLCEIGWKLDQEIEFRKITTSQIEKTIEQTHLSPQDSLMVSTYIYPESNCIIGKIGKS